MSNFRTSSLFHYTKYNELRSILKEGLIPNYCREEITTGRNNYILGIPMISFCDIPLTKTKEFAKRYGRHAIGFRKEWALKNNINPITYLIEDILPASLSPSELLMGFLKNYNGVHKGKSQCNYEENEWRRVISNSTTITWKLNDLEYTTWRGTGNKKPNADTYLKSYKLTFSIDDISYIILEQENQRVKVIDYVSKMTSVGGVLGSVVNERDKLKLISKIISMEQIKKDF